MFPRWSRLQKFADSLVPSWTIRANKTNFGYVPNLCRAASARETTTIRCTSQKRNVVREDRSSRGIIPVTLDIYTLIDRSFEGLAGRSTEYPKSDPLDVKSTFTIRTCTRWKPNSVKAINGDRSIPRSSVSRRVRVFEAISIFSYTRNNRTEYCRGTSCVHNISTLRAKFPSLSSVYI